MKGSEPWRGEVLFEGSVQGGPGGQLLGHSTGYVQEGYAEDQCSEREGDRVESVGRGKRGGTKGW